MKTYVLPYGKGNQKADIPEDHVLYDLHGPHAEAVEDEEQAVREALRHPIDCQPLDDIIQPSDTVCIVVSDITRLVHTDRMLPVLVQELNRIGVQDHQITVLVSQGTHRAHTEQENEIVCGSDMVRRLHIVQHDCHDASALTCVGRTSFGNDVYINSLAAKADKLILTGAVSFHPMAGFGGGRKAVLPGIAGFDTIMRNHSLALSEVPGGGCHPGCHAGALEGNPFHEDMKEACAMVRPDFFINTVFTPDGDLYEVVAGHWNTAWEKGCRDLLRIGSVPIQKLADVTIASAGGYPKDLNLYQSVKAYMNAVLATRPGGILIFTLECPDIQEPAIFTDWFFRNDLDACERELRNQFLMPGFVAFKARCIIQSMKAVYVVTRKENFDVIRRSGQIPAATLEEAWQMARTVLEEEGCRDYGVTIMSHAAATLPVLCNIDT
ncbi:nickel-dependent lactate racemase [uncultured Megasphaera sp.]|uniref:nickel-dependent lactate racemase n=1 Tax=uncultured Megasphaera sp. TaxID=165188 RepID=UPI0026074DCA|nr:nickel-dependent lactate racemase [uncultured Megasphaera sp.]